MVAMREQDEVLNGVVELIAIFVMDRFVGVQEAAKVLFHYVAMFKDLTTFDRNEAIAVFSDTAALERCVTRTKPSTPATLVAAIHLLVSRGIERKRASGASSCHRLIVT